MKIIDVQRDIEESLASLPTLTLPPELEGLRHLPVGDHNPQVSIHYVNGSRKVREDASASYFDPDRCELVISFVPLEVRQHEDAQPGYGAVHSDEPAGELDFERAMGQLVDELKAAEGVRPFVGLKWFRDQFLPGCGHSWTRDQKTNGALLRRMTEQRLILTSQVPNPNQPLHPVTAIRVNRRHPRFQPDVPGRSAGFKPVRIRGGSISDTVLSDRR